MHVVLLPWFELAVCTLVLALAGPVLIRNGEKIALTTGLSRSLIGVILLATATSMPELITGLSAVTIADAPNIAVADALGSCIFNLLMLVILDEFSRSEPLFRTIDQGHILTAGFGIILIGAVGAIILLDGFAMDLTIVHISFFTPILMLLYFVAMRAGFAYQMRQRDLGQRKETMSRAKLNGPLGRFVAAAGVVTVAGIWLPFIGVEIAVIMGWKTTFVGTLLIAGSTSVPELVVTISALRMRAPDMAIGGLLGSNLFDVLILAMDDAAYTKGSLFAAVSSAHAVTALAAVIMSGIFIVALLFRPDSRIWGRISWMSIALLGVYLFSAYAAFLAGE